MGNALKWYQPSTEKRDGTTLIELRIPHIRDAHDVIGLSPEIGYTPITLVPESAVMSCCCVPCCCVSIPNGFSAIVSRWGADIVGGEKDGTWSPGFHCFNPCCGHHINRLVSQELIVFDTPVKECKTKDNITVEIDVLILLQVTSATDFIYGLGPEKLDLLLRASQEEVVRKMASQTEVLKIYDLHGKDTADLVKDMNEHFKPYGINIHHFTIKNVTIPMAMATDMEETTLYQSMTEEKLMQQESNRLRLNHSEGTQKLKEECENVRLAAEEQATTSLAQIKKEISEVIALTEKQVALTNTETDAMVDTQTADSNKQVAETDAQAHSLEQKLTAETHAEVEKLEVVSRSYCLGRKAKAKMESAEKLSAGKKAIAEEEGNAAYAFKAKRDQEQEQARLKILDRMCDNAKIQISTTHENTMGLAPDNSLVNQVAQQGIETLRMKLAEMTSKSITSLNMGQKVSGGLVRPVPQIMAP